MELGYPHTETHTMVVQFFMLGGELIPLSPLPVQTRMVPPGALGPSLEADCRTLGLYA